MSSRLDEKMKALLQFVAIAALLVLFGETVAAEPAKWTRLADTNPPERRAGAGAVYCPGRDSFLLFGGIHTVSSTGRLEFSNDLWEYSFQSNGWSPINLPVRPSPREWFTMVTVTDSVTPGDCQAILYGGFMRNSTSSTAGYESSEVWSLNMINGTIEWELITTTSSGPGRRSLSQAVYRRGKMVVFAGTQLQPPFPATSAIALNDLWYFDLSPRDESGRNASVWTQIMKPNADAFTPDARFGHTMSLKLGSTPDADELYVFAGRSYSTTGESAMLSDLVVYSFGSNTWRTANGLRLERTLHSSIITNSRLVVFGGSLRVPDSPTRFSTYVFDSVLVTNLDPALNRNLGDTTVEVPSCTSTDGKTGLWCVVDVKRNEDEPLVRFNFAYAQRDDQMIVYGGEFQGLLGDMWMLNVTRSVQELNIAEADALGASDLASTMYFMIAILSMMVVCFIVFVISLRRQRSTGPIFQGMMVNRPRVVGARQSVIEALPLKTYKKKEADERRASRRQSRIDAQKAAVPESAAAVNPADSSSVEASSGALSSVVATESNDRIEQDDLHDLCAICLTEYEDGEQLRVLPCEHFFHPDCVDQWLRTHNACPMCKAAVDLDPDRSEEPNPNQQLVAAAESSDNPAFLERGQSAASNNEPRATMSSASNIDPESRVNAAESTASAMSAMIPRATTNSNAGLVVIDLAEERRPTSASIPQRSPSVSVSTAAIPQRSPSVSSSAAAVPQRSQSISASAAAIPQRPPSEDSGKQTIDLNDDGDQPRVSANV